MSLDPVATVQSDHDLLVRLDERTNNILTAMGELKEASKTKNEDHESRLRSLERQRWMLAGGATILGALGGTGLSAIAALFS